MEGFVGPFGQNQRAGGHGERHHHGLDEQLEPVGRDRRSAREGRVEDPKLFSLLTLLHALGELGLLKALQQRLVELAGAFVVSGEFPELLLPPGHVLHPRLIGRDPVSEPPFLALEDLDVRFRLPQGLLQAEEIRGERRRLRGRRLAVRFELAGLDAGKLVRDRGDLGGQQDDIRISFAETGAEPRELLFQPIQARFRGLGRGSRPARRQGRGGKE